MSWQYVWYFRRLMLTSVCCALTLGACESMKMPMSSQEASSPQPTTTAASPTTPVATPQTKGPKKRIAVLPFTVGATTYSWSGVEQAAAEMLTTALFKTGQFILIERSVLDKVLAEQGLGRSGVIDPSTAADVGRVLGVQAIVTGAITQLGQSNTGGGTTFFRFGSTSFEAAVDIRVIDTSTAQLLLVDTGKGTVSTTQVQFQGTGGGESAEREKLLGNALRQATEDVAQKLLLQMRTVPWSGRIAQITSNGVYINAGADLGLEAGQNLEVFRTGNTIKDPVTGLILGVEETPIGLLLLTDIKEGYAIAVPSQGSSFKINDIVRLK